MMAQKKSFSKNLNPAMQFISAPPEETPVNVIAESPPVGFKINPLYIETKSKRLQLLVQPSIYNKIKEKANKESKSVNELIHSILENAVNND